MSVQGPSCWFFLYSSGAAKPGVYIGKSLGASCVSVWRAAPKSSSMGRPPFFR